MAHMRSNPPRPEDTGLAPAVDWEPCPEDTGLAPAVDWEPCPEFTADSVEPGVCTGCGWLEDDHVVDVRRAA